MQNECTATPAEEITEDICKRVSYLYFLYFGSLSGAYMYNSMN